LTTTDAELTELQQENDSGTINVNGEQVEVEYGWFSDNPVYSIERCGVNFCLINTLLAQEFNYAGT